MANSHILFLCVVVVYIVSTNATNEDKTKIFKSIKMLDSKKALMEFRDSSSVRVVYYFKKDVPRLRLFFTELDKSAEYLDLYGVKIGLCECSVPELAKLPDCFKSKVEQKIYTYRHGQLLLFLELETMFDVNSIMSNILQLVLLRQVPILQTPDEVTKFLGKNKGKTDTIFGYMKAIGTFDHRVFMEVAYAYQDKFKFAICTERKGVSMFEEDIHLHQDKSVFWWVWTKDMAEDNFDFHSLQYRDELTLAAFAKFVKAISLPKMFDIPSEGLEHPYSQVELSSVQFYYNDATKQDIFEKANLVARHFLGSLTITLYDMDRDENTGRLPEGQSAPALSITLMQTASFGEEPIFLKEPLTTDNIATFLEGTMSAVTPGSTDSTLMSQEDHDGGDDDSRMPPDVNIDEVETQDDRVAEAVYQTRHIKMPLDLVPALTDKTFPAHVKSADTVVITFYFPFDALSMAFLRMFGEAADRIGQGQKAGAKVGLGRVNCYDWTDVCALQNISIYPTMRVFRHGERDWDYKGPMDTQEIYSTLKILEFSPPVQLHDKQEVLAYLTGSADIAPAVTNVTVVALLETTHTSERSVFTEAACENRDRIVYAATDITEAADIASQMGAHLPAVILAKYEDPIQPHVVFTGDFTKENIRQFVYDNKLPKLAKLTPLMFPQLRARSHDFVILFTDSSARCQVPEDSLREIVRAGSFNNVSFTLMPVPDMLSVGAKVLNKYTEDPSLPFISYVNLNKGEVFNFDQSDFHKDTVSSWIVSVVSHSVQPSTVLTAGEWKPAVKGYDFLKIIDWQQKEEQKQAKEAHKKSGRLSKEPIDRDAYMDIDGEEPIELEADDDVDVRNELFEQRSSRLYHHPSPDREKVARHGEKDGGKMQAQTAKHDHTEL